MIQIELATGHELDALSAALELPKRDGLEADDAYRDRLRAHYLRQSATKTDRELLELAAKAIGLTGSWSTTLGGWPCLVTNGVGQPWQPLHDDGDALRLAVKLNLLDGLERRASDLAAEVNYDMDPCAATRLAIVRAAAAIGEAMP